MKLRYSLQKLHKGVSKFRNGLRKLQDGISKLQYDRPKLQNNRLELQNKELKSSPDAYPRQFVLAEKLSSEVQLPYDSYSNFCPPTDASYIKPPLAIVMIATPPL